MLPAVMRMRAKDDFTTTVRRGRRCGQRRLVVHLQTAPPTPQQASDLQDLGTEPARGRSPQQLSAGVDRRSSERLPDVLVGFVVSRQVGSSVVRNQVERRLRHVCRPLLPDLPQGARLVVRALPASAGASSRELGADLRAALNRCLSGPSTSRRRPTDQARDARTGRS